MTEYTPTTEEVRAQWGNAVDYHRSPQQRLRGFDRWLSELIRKEREEAWDAGHMQGISDRDAATLEGSYWVVPFTDNPYRKEKS